MPIDLPDGIILGNRWVIQQRLGSGLQGTNYLADDEHIGRDVALKVEVLERPDQVLRWKEEALALVRAAGSPNLPRYFDHERVAFETDEGSVELGCIACERIVGDTLEEFVSGNPDKLVSVPFYAYLLEQLGHALWALHSAKLAHGDIHERNVLLEPSPENPFLDSTSEYRIILVDFGKIRLIGESREEVAEDLRQVGAHILRYLMNSLETSGPRGADRETILRWGRAAVDRLCEPQPTMTPNEVTVLREVARSIRPEGGKPPQTLDDPFDCVSAEYIPQESPLRAQLMIRDAKWYADTIKWGNTLITGPRGCGKSMVLLDMRLYTHIAASTLDDAHVPFTAHKYVGLYVKCSPDFFPRVPNSAAQETWTADAIRYLFALCSLDDFLEALNLLDQRIESGQLAPHFRPSSAWLADMVEFVKRWTDSPLTGLPSYRPFNALRGAIAGVHNTVRRHIAEGSSLELPQPPLQFFREFVQLLHKSTVFADHRVVFLIDDLRLDTVGAEGVRAFNEVFTSRESDFCFKAATEPYAWVDVRWDGSRLMPDRNYTLVDVGVEYHKPGAEFGSPGFIADLLDQRFTLTPDCHTTAQRFFGDGKVASWEEFATRMRQHLRGERDEDGKPMEAPLYAGHRLLLSLCSADVHHFIRLSKAIKDAADRQNIAWHQGEGVPPQIQDKAVRGFSNWLRETISRTPETGIRLANVIREFGAAAQSMLKDRTVSRGNGRRSPGQYIRAEIDATAELEGPAREIEDGLIRAGVFVNLGLSPGRSRAQASVKRLLFRRLLCPSFNLSAANRDPWRLGLQGWREFLLQPHEARLKIAHARDDRPLPLDGA